MRIGRPATTELAAKLARLLTLRDHPRLTETSSYPPSGRLARSSHSRRSPRAYPCPARLSSVLHSAKNNGPSLSPLSQASTIICPLVSTSCCHACLDAGHLCTGSEAGPGCGARTCRRDSSVLAFFFWSTSILPSTLSLSTAAG